MKPIKLSDQLKALEDKIKNVYEAGVTMDEAEKLAAEFLHAGLVISSRLKNADLDRRMRKSGLRALRSALRIKEVQGTEKKPTESMLDAIIDTNELVQKEQDAFDTAEVDKEELERLFNTFREAHIYFRSVARGKFE